MFAVYDLCINENTKSIKNMQNLITLVFFFKEDIFKNVSGEKQFNLVKGHVNVIYRIICTNLSHRAPKNAYRLLRIS